MGLYISKLIALLVLPPGVIIIGLVMGVVFIIKGRLKTGIYTLSAFISILYLLCTPIMSDTLMELAETHNAIPPEKIKDIDAQAIVVLGAGRHYNTVEYDGDAVNKHALERIRYGATLHHKTGLPILVTGGTVFERRISQGHLMAKALEQSFQVKPRWIEDKSRNTAENAQFSFTMLDKEGIRKILLVTHASHMGRSVPIFEQQGFEVIPAPTGFEGYDGAGISFRQFIPNGPAFADSFYALHELLGRLWYWIRY